MIYSKTFLNRPTMGSTVNGSYREISRLRELEYIVTMALYWRFCGTQIKRLIEGWWSLCGGGQVEYHRMVLMNADVYLAKVGILVLLLLCANIHI